jgi:hypothetical protein
VEFVFWGTQTDFELSILVKKNNGVDVEEKPWTQR